MGAAAFGPEAHACVARRRRTVRGTLASAETGRDPHHVLLVGSAGGHLAQLLALRPWWEQRQRTWVTFDTLDASSRLAGEERISARAPTTRNVPNLFCNFFLAER